MQQVSVLCDKIEKTEKLYRVIKRSRPDCITAQGTVSPALFKDSAGVSVDRDGGREIDEIICFITEVTFPRRAKAVTAFSAELCYEVDIEIKADPSEKNPYHANLLLDDEEKNGNLQALQLADRCSLVYFNDMVEWTK